jgi:hypothetical protein
MSYTTDAEGKWCLLVGLASPDGGKTIGGQMQLFFIEKKQQ